LLKNLWKNKKIMGRHLFFLGGIFPVTLFLGGVFPGGIFLGGFFPDTAEAVH